MVSGDVHCQRIQRGLNGKWDEMSPALEGSARARRVSRDTSPDELFVLQTRRIARVASQFARRLAKRARPASAVPTSTKSAVLGRVLPVIVEVE